MIDLYERAGIAGDKIGTAASFSLAGLCKKEVGEMHYHGKLVVMENDKKGINCATEFAPLPH